MKFELGEILKDKITGFQGVAMARTEYFTDCTHYGLAAQKVKDDGTVQDWQWFDETRLVKIDGCERIEKEPRCNPQATSGPEANAPQW